MEQEKLTSLLKQVKTIALNTGQWVASQQSSFNRGHIDTKFINNLVTDIDKESEHRITNALRSLLPEAGIIGEEGVNNKSGIINWIIDPLDGTTNYIHGIPQVAISIALAQGEEILLGVVYEIYRQECFAAYKGGGATLNGAPISVSTTTQLEQSLLATGLPFYDFQYIKPYFASLEFFMRHTRGIRRCGSAATDLCYVACGRYDGFFEQTLQPWDMAAGICIIQEAGGVCTDFNRGNLILQQKEIIAANPLIHILMSNIIGDKYDDLS